MLKFPASVWKGNYVKFQIGSLQQRSALQWSKYLPGQAVEPGAGLQPGIGTVLKHKILDNIFSGGKRSVNSGLPSSPSTAPSRRGRGCACQGQVSFTNKSMPSSSKTYFRLWQNWLLQGRVHNLQEVHGPRRRHIHSEAGMTMKWKINWKSDKMSVAVKTCNLINSLLAGSRSAFNSMVDIEIFLHQILHRRFLTAQTVSDKEEGAARQPVTSFQVLPFIPQTVQIYPLPKMRKKMLLHI